MNEATARIKINKLLEAAGWRFFPEDGGPANIRLEPGVTIKSTDLDPLGDDVEKTEKGVVDFLLSLRCVPARSARRPTFAASHHRSRGLPSALLAASDNVL
jgi:hypothetical protein